MALAVDVTTTGATLSSFCPGMTGSDPLGPRGLEASCEIGIPLSGDGGGDGTGSVGLSVQDASGKPLTTISPLTISVDRQLLARNELRHEGVWQLHGPGQYRAVFTAPDGTTVVRTVQVQG